MKKGARKRFLILVFLVFTLRPAFGAGPDNVNNDNTAQAAHTLIIEPQDGREPILQAIKNSRYSIDLAIYAFSDPEICAALIEAHKRGVAVRVLYNHYSFLRLRQPDENRYTVEAMSAAGIETRVGSKKFLVTHQKTFIFDGSLAMIMTFNLRPQYFSRTRDFGIITRKNEEVAEITEVFDADWDSRGISPAVLSLVWSPVNSREKIINLINNAKDTLQIYNEEIEDRDCLFALIDAARRGVKVRFFNAVVMRKGKDVNKRLRDRLNQNGVTVKVDKSLYTHAKMILADFGTSSALAFLGSENFSPASLDKNRELGIILREKDILEKLNEVFNQDWARLTSRD